MIVIIQGVQKNCIFSILRLLQHWAVIGCTKYGQPIGVTEHSHYFQWIGKKHNFCLTPCTSLSIKYSMNSSLCVQLYGLSHGACPTNSKQLTGQGQGRHRVILRGGHRYIYNRKDDIMHGLSIQVENVLRLYLKTCP